MLSGQHRSRTIRRFFHSPPVLIRDIKFSSLPNYRLPKRVFHFCSASALKFQSILLENSSEKTLQVLSMSWEEAEILCKNSNMSTTVSVLNRYSELGFNLYRENRSGCTINLLSDDLYCNVAESIRYFYLTIPRGRNKKTEKKKKNKNTKNRNMFHALY
jgi:hypothetical protein